MKQIQETKEAVSTRNKLLWILFIFLGGLIYFVSDKFVNNLEKRRLSSLSACPTDVQNYIGYTCGEFGIMDNPVLAIEIENLTPSNAFAILEGFPILSDSDPGMLVTFNVEVSIFAVDEKRNIKSVITSKENKLIQFLPQPEGQAQYTSQAFGMVTNIQNDRYIFVIRIWNNQQILDIKVEDIRFGFIVSNSALEQNLFYFKAFLFVVAIVGCMLYQINLSKLPKSFISSEQRYISIMGLILILFDQPFFQYSKISDSSILTTFTVIITVAQASILILYWFSLLERLSSSTDSLPSRSKLIIMICVLVNFLLLFATLSNLANHQMRNPLFDLQTDSSVTSSRYYLYAFAGIGGIWTLARVCPIIPRLRDLDWRDGMALIFSVYYVLYYGFFTVSGDLQVSPIMGSRIVLFYGITTLYTILLQVMYSSFGAEIREADKRKDYDVPSKKYEDLDSSSASGRADKMRLKNHDELKHQNEEFMTGEHGMEI